MVNLQFCPIIPWTCSARKKSKEIITILLKFPKLSKILKLLQFRYVDVEDLKILWLFLLFLDVWLNRCDSRTLDLDKKKTATEWKEWAQNKFSHQNLLHLHGPKIVIVPCYRIKICVQFFFSCKPHTQCARKSGRANEIKDERGKRKRFVLCWWKYLSKS